VSHSSSGVLYAVAAYGFWGLTPLYWKAVEVVPPPELLGHRILWSCAVGLLLVSAGRAWPEVRRCVASPRHGLPILAAARRLRLATLGFFQYLAPSVAFLLAVFAFGEPFTPTHAFTFACVWLALAVYSLGALRSPGASSAPALGSGR
jgi:EamA domain-containing membrane protein RarD